MDDELSRTYRRWHEAEENGRDEDAEAAFRAIFASTVQDDPVPARFAAGTLERIAEVATADARRARRTRTAAIAIASVGGVVLAYFGAGLLGSLVASAISRMLNGVVAIVVAVARAGPSGASIWSVLASLGRAAAAFAADPIVTITILAIQGVAIAALVALQRLLGSEWESSR